MRARLTSFKSNPSFKTLGRLTHGGEVGKGKRKLRRPIDPKRSIHLVMRSSKAKGEWSFLLHEEKIRFLVEKYATKNGVKIHQFANVGNHLHLVVKPRARIGFQRFLKTISGLIPRMITGAKKGTPTGKFWDGPAFTRVVSWDKSYDLAHRAPETVKLMTSIA